MLGAAVTFTLVVNHGQSFWLASALAVVVSALMGLVIEYVCLRPLRRRRAPPIAALISTIGLALIIVAAVEQGRPGTLFSWLWVDGANSVSLPPGVAPNPTWHVAGLTHAGGNLTLFPITVPLTLLLGIVMRSINVARALGAVTETP